MAAAIPNIEFTNNNRGGLDIRCENYIFQVKTTGKKAALYRCPTKKPNQCFASISLKTRLPEGSDSPEVIQPFQVTNLNLNHVEGCNPKPNDFFEEISFIKNVKETVTIDFEIAAKIAAKIAFESVFDVKVIGCLFHFGQSLFKKLNN